MSVIGVFGLPPIGVCYWGGGGGSAGTVGFAEYVEKTHEEWLGVTAGPVAQATDKSIVDIMNSLFSTAVPATTPNPYTLAESLDPTVDLDAVKSRYDTFANLLTSLTDNLSGHRTAWGGDADAARGKIDEESFTPSVNVTSKIAAIVTAASSAATQAIANVLGDSPGQISTILEESISSALTVLESAPIQSAVDEYEESISGNVARAKSSFAGGMADVNAVGGSAFILGMAMIENERVGSVNKFAANLALQIYQSHVSSHLQATLNLTAGQLEVFSRAFTGHVQSQIGFDMQIRQARDGMLNSATQQLSQMLYNNMGMEQAVTGLLLDIKRTAISAKHEWYQEDIRLDAEEKLWDLKIYNYGANILGGMNTGGGTFIPEGASKTASSLSVGLGGAVLGAKMGAIGGPVGMGIGALVGGVGGMIAGAQ